MPFFGAPTGFIVGPPPQTQNRADKVRESPSSSESMVFHLAEQLSDLNPASVSNSLHFLKIQS